MRHNFARISRGRSMLHRRSRNHCRRLEHYDYARPRFLSPSLHLRTIALVLSPLPSFSVISEPLPHRPAKSHPHGPGGPATQVRSSLKQSMRLSWEGIAIGCFASYFLTRRLSANLGLVRPSFYLRAVVRPSSLHWLLACLIPARRAPGRVPLVALRCNRSIADRSFCNSQHMRCGATAAIMRVCPRGPFGCFT